MAVDQHTYFTALANSLIQSILPSRDGHLAFEFFAALYTLVTMFLQYVHLYRTVFWLPHSYKNSALHFNLIEKDIVLFTVIITLRRFIWVILKYIIHVVTPTSWIPSCVIVFRSLITSLILSNLLYLCFSIAINYHVFNIMFLAYPCFVYFALFGFSAEHFLELCPSESFLKHVGSMYDSETSKLTSMTTLPHSPPSNPELVRRDADLKILYLNEILKQVGFSAICSAYYATFLPLVFLPMSLHYKVSWVWRHLALTYVGNTTLYFIYFLPANFIYELHCTASYLGSWSKFVPGQDDDAGVTEHHRSVVRSSQKSSSSAPHALYSSWSPSIYWHKGAIVKCGKVLYRAEGHINSCDPQSTSHRRFVYLFGDVSTFNWVVMILQSGLVHAQHLSLVWSSEWYLIISESMFVFLNYYVLYKTIRDFFVFIKISSGSSAPTGNLTSLSSNGSVSSSSTPSTAHGQGNHRASTVTGGGGSNSKTKIS